METQNQLLSLRQNLKSATSKEELVEKTRDLLKTLPNRYKPLREYVALGNADIKERLSFLKETVEGDFLDIGSYDGFFVFELEQKGHEAVGVDMMDEAIKLSTEEKGRYPNSEAKFYKGFAEDLPFENSHFDTTIASHTLEHVFDPATALSEAARVTRGGGKLIAIVPPTLGNDPTHLRRVDPEWLESELAKYGEVSPQQIVGDGIAYVCRINANKKDSL